MDIINANLVTVLVKLAKEVNCLIVYYAIKVCYFKKGNVLKIVMKDIKKQDNNAIKLMISLLILENGGFI